jgi:hypothetical protein
MTGTVCACAGLFLDQVCARPELDDDRPEHRAVLGAISVLDGLGDFLTDVGEDATRCTAQPYGWLGMAQAHALDGEGGADDFRGGERRVRLIQAKRDEGQSESNGSRNDAAHT